MAHDALGGCDFDHYPRRAMALYVQRGMIERARLVWPTFQRTRTRAGLERRGFGKDGINYAFNVALVFFTAANQWTLPVTASGASATRSKGRIGNNYGQT